MIKTHVYSSIYFSTTILIFFDKFYDLCMSFQFYVILHVWASGTQQIVRSEWFREREVFSYKGEFYDLCMSFQFYVILHVWASGTQQIVRSEWFREREVFSYKGRYPLRGKSPRTSIVSLQFFIDDLAGYGNFCN